MLHSGMHVLQFNLLFRFVTQYNITLYADNLLFFRVSSALDERSPCEVIERVC